MFRVTLRRRGPKYEYPECISRFLNGVGESEWLPGNISREKLFNKSSVVRIIVLPVDGRIEGSPGNNK
jgi:hypothetical protein